MTTEIPIPKIKFIGNVLQDKLCIPPYQRPYKWKADKHVRQLLLDIWRESQQKTFEYRIGTLILHNENGQLDIVDGQQRLVTITLILKALEYFENISLLKQKFTHNSSKDNIKYNFSFIQEHFKVLPPDKREIYKNYLLNHCSFVVITLSDLPEAFQLFDSQNARGKSLEPEDLLKAFHLREMDSNSTNEKKECVSIWEKAIDQGVLYKVISKYIYRIRNWKRKDLGYYFTKDNLDEFKGISLIKSIQEGKVYPYINLAYQSSFSTNYQLNEPIVNGKRFFNYVDHYVQIYNDLKEFQDNKNEHKLEFYYLGCYRIGDNRLRTFYKIILMCYYDKFGRDSCFVGFAKELYRWTFMFRLTKTAIRYEFVRNLQQDRGEINPIKIIESWYYPDIFDFRKKIGLLENVQIIKEINEIIDCIHSIEQA